MLFVDLSEQLANGGRGSQNDTTQRRIRKHVMKDFRRRQRDNDPLPVPQAGQSDKGQVHPSHVITKFRVANPKGRHWISCTPAPVDSPALPIVKPLPRSSGDQFRADVVDWIQYAGLEGSWWTLLPSRVEHHACIDLSLAAIVSATQIIRGVGNRPKATLALHGKAVQSLRAVLSDQSAASNDFALVAARLMGMLQMVLRQSKAVNRKYLEWNADADEVAHGEGALALLERRPVGSRDSGLYRGILYAEAAWNVFTLPLVNNKASPLEDLQWSQVEPLFQTPRPELAILQKASLRVYGALPGLIKSIREMGSETDAESSDDDREFRVHGAIADLILTSNETAESHMIEQSLAYRDLVCPVGFSIAFMSTDDYHAGLAYWVTRVLLCQLIEACFLKYPSWRRSLECYNSTQLVQSARYLMATTTYTRSLRINHKPVACLGFEALWGVLEDHGRDISEGWSPEQLQMWIKQEYTAVPEVDFVVTNEYMDGWTKIYRGIASPSECF